MGSKQAEIVADAVLRAAGSGFKHYMPSTKANIIAECEKAMHEAIENAKAEGESSMHFKCVQACIDEKEHQLGRGTPQGFLIANNIYARIFMLNAKEMEK
jgi:hypothetical protein